MTVRTLGFIGMLSLVGTLVLTACGSGSSTDAASSVAAVGSGASSSGGTGGASSVASSGTGGSSSASGTGGASGSSTASASSSSGMMPADPGHTSSDFVGAGHVVKSANYQMTFTLGQSSPSQSVTTSQNYSMRSGVIGATGSAK